MPILTGAQIDRAGVATFNPMGARGRFGWDRIKWKAPARGVIHTVTLVGVVKLDADEISCGDAGYNDERHAVNCIRIRRCGWVSTQVGVQMASASVIDEGNIAGRRRIDRPRTDIDIPPVVSWREREWTRYSTSFHGSDSGT